MALDTLVVDGDALKRALGIEDDSEDALLSDLEARAVEWVERELHRRFQPPEERIEYRPGSGTRTLYLNGHVDDADATVAVRERSLCGGDWATVDDVDFERRGDTLVRIDSYIWSCGAEYELTYDDGYADAPGDIQQLIIDLVAVERARSSTTASVSSGDAGIKSETIGEYSYTMDSAAATSATTTSTTLSATSAATLNRWRRGRL